MSEGLGPNASVDVAVIGLGLIGSAALRHLSRSGRSVIGIGPAEPDDWATAAGPFASHYDSGRVTRRIDARREWAVLASRAIAEYPVIEAASGIGFHQPAGLLFVRNDAGGIANQLAVADDLGIPISVGPTEDRRTSFPDLAFPDGWTAIHEGPPAGHIDPRLLARAQVVAAEKQGARALRLAATSLARDGDRWWIGLADGQEVSADDVVVATGPYPNDLLPEPLAISVRPEAVVLAELDDAEAARLADLPSVIYLLDHPDLDDVYVVPPVRYPDGKLYIKMGGSHRTARGFVSAAEKHAWMSGTEADRQLDVMRGVLQAMLPAVRFISWAMKPCLISDTVFDLPYIDRIDQGLFVAVGGSGHAAKSSDAIGALVAGLVVNNGLWTDPELAAETFTAQRGEYVPGPGSRHGN